MTPGIQELMRAIEKVRDGYRAAVLAGDVDAALAVCAPTVTLERQPVGTGAVGIDALRAHLATEVLPYRPAELTHTRISRTVDRFRVVDEERVGFVHDRELPWLLPGIAPTGGRADVLVITVVTVRQARIGSVRALWDHTSLLAQLGLSAAVAIAPPLVRQAVDEPSSWW